MISNGVIAQYHSLCWQVTGHGLHQPSYLYGTMHVSDPRVFKFSPKMRAALSGTRVYAMELDPEQSMDMSLVLQMMMPEGQSIHAMLPDSDYHYIDSLLTAQSGMGMALYDRMEPIIIESLLETIGIGATKDSSAQAQALPLDLYLYQDARKHHLKTVGIETASEQIAALHTLSYAEQAALLQQSIADLRNNKSSETQDMMQLYLDQNLDSLLAISDEGKMPPQFYKALFTDRNSRMATRIAKLIASKSTFVAIGALHLPGASGVIALLRKAGYTVKEWR
jgi:uncharacterized protein